MTQSIKNQFNNSNLHNPIFRYGDKQVYKILGKPPFAPTLWVGRQADLKNLHQQLFSGQNNGLVLVNGKGGIGKTSLASQYYHTYAEEYTHLAWVLAEPDLGAALLTLANALQVEFPREMEQEARLHQLTAAMASLNKPCLLVIDNANDLDALENYYLILQACSNFHILLTSRLTKFQHLDTFPVGTLSPQAALQIFRTYYQVFDPTDEADFHEIFEAVEGNTLLIELLAKNLHFFNDDMEQHYPLRQLKADLEQSLTRFSKNAEVKTTYQAKGTGLRTESVEAIVLAMYDVGHLNDYEKTLLAHFSLLPPESLAYTLLEELLPLPPPKANEVPSLSKALLRLDQKGWIDYNPQDKSFKCSPVIQAIVRDQHQDNLATEVTPLLYKLIEKLDYEGSHLTGTTYSQAAELARWGAYLNDALQQSTPDLIQVWEGGLQDSIATLYERLGEYHTIVGDLATATQFFEQYLELQQQLCQAYPKNPSFKNGLAIAYSKLGETHRNLGDQNKALHFFEKDLEWQKQLYEDFPENANVKNRLAISYSKLGITYQNLGDQNKALQFFKQYSELRQQLYQDFPKNANFKNGLAIAYSKLGETYQNLGDQNKALQLFEQYSELLQQLYQDFPKNANFKNGLAIAYFKLGTTYRKLEDQNKALHFFEKETELFEQLYQDFPKNVAFKQGIAVSYAKLGGFYRESDPSKAKAYFTQAEQLWIALTETSPSTVRYQEYLEIIRDELKTM
mgnify:CR=1 FL=1